MASDFGTPQSHAIKDESGVISKGWCIRGALSPGFINGHDDGWWFWSSLSSVFIDGYTLDLMSDRYIRC